MSDQNGIEDQLILNAFQGPFNRWRIPAGVALQLGLPESAVIEFVEKHPELFERSSLSPLGMPMYGLRQGALKLAS